MQRSGIWIHQEPPEYPMLRGRKNADAVVVGGGLAGLTTALWLTKAGLKVTLLEAERLGWGATSRCGGIVSLEDGLLFARLEKNHGQEAARTYALTQKAALRAVEELAGDACGFQREDVHIVSANGGEALEKEAECMKRAGVAATVTRSTQCPLPAAHALVLGGMGVLDPMRYMRCMAKEGVSKGLRIYEHSRVVSMETNLAGTERGSVIAPYVIVATGYPIVNVPGWYFLRLTQRQAWLARLSGEALFQGAYYDHNARFGLRRLRGGALLQLAGGLVGDAENAGLFQRFFNENGALVGAPIETEIGLQIHTGDGLPYAGPYAAKTPNMFVATGFGGRGIVGSMVAAQAVCARVLGLEHGDYDIYSGSRHTRRDVKTPLRLAGRYMRGYIAHPSAPRCPHMGCKLVYDPLQRLWLCPCHGSRFDGIGRVLNAPATHDAPVGGRR